MMNMKFIKKKNIYIFTLALENFRKFIVLNCLLISFSWEVIKAIQGDESEAIRKSENGKGSYIYSLIYRDRLT